jgi:hypothetical protein
MNEKRILLNSIKKHLVVLNAPPVSNVKKRWRMIVSYEIRNDFKKLDKG